MARPRRYKDGVQFSVRLDREMVDALQARADQLEIDRSQLISKLLKRHLKENPFEESESPDFEQMQKAAEDPAPYKAKPNQSVGA